MCPNQDRRRAFFFAKVPAYFKTQQTKIMKNMTPLFRWSFVTLMLASSGILFAGCQSPKTESSPNAESSAAPAVAPVVVQTTPAAPVPAAPAGMTLPLRIKAGTTESVKDADGNTWLPEQGFADGDTVDRPDLQIENTKSPALYRSEHYSMSKFSVKVPNGKYTVKLHFCETFEGIEGPGQRVFSFNVMGHEFKDFDVWVKAGGPRKAYVETVGVDVTSGQLDITFTSNVENPQINAIEIIPAS